MKHANSKENIVRISVLKYFIASLRLPGSFWGLLVGFLIKEITCQVSRKTQKTSRKPLLSYKKFQVRNPYNIFIAILVETMTTKRHFETN
jgi:hypothetical protein